MSGLFEAYTTGKAGAFFEGHFAQPEDRRRARRVVRPIEPALADVLEAQNARYAPSAKRSAHVQALRTGAAAVVTGQQVGLLLGPLYTLYKAASTVRLARALEEEWGVPVVPVFWLQTEDHDLPEIATVHVARPRGEPLTLQLPAPDERVSVAHRLLPEAVHECLEKLGGAIGPLPHGEEHLARLARHYRAGAGWSEAFAGVVAELFAEQGLVLLDPRDPALAPLAAPVHRTALLSARPFAEALGERVRALETAGFPVAVHVREAAPLFFFHPDGREGPRFRLEAEGDDFSEVGGAGVHTRAALLEALEDRPGCFSTSALLRPILQDTWLPTAAYVGGPGEIAYFAQLPPLYALYDLPMPLIVPRVRLRLLEDKPRRLLARMNLTPTDVCRPFEEALSRARADAAGEPTGEILSQRLLETFDGTLREMTPVLSKGGSSVDKALGRTRATVADAVKKLGHKYDKARLYQDQAVVDDVQRLQWWLYPGGQPQERYYGMSYFAAQYGEGAFLERVLAAAVPFETELRDLEL